MLLLLMLPSHPLPTWALQYGTLQQRVTLQHARINCYQDFIPTSNELVTYDSPAELLWVSHFREGHSCSRCSWPPLSWFGSCPSGENIEFVMDKIKLQHRLSHPPPTTIRFYYKRRRFIKYSALWECLLFSRGGRGERTRPKNDLKVILRTSC